ncbi:MAG: hypothetical protein NTV73_06255 [Hyphomicrobiales bacterium]|nr:hypothetical protein [Hyphomicrobiales bacterium]
MERAGRYVLGLMDDDERERAERDLEIDPAFRDAMMEVAERMHVFGSTAVGGEEPQDQWRLVKDRIDAMPQMRRAGDGPRVAGDALAAHEPPERPVTFGRRKSDVTASVIVPSTERAFRRIGPGSVPDRRALLLALCLVGAFALGYFAGVSSGARSNVRDVAAQP